MPWQLGIPDLGGRAYAAVGQAISDAAKGAGDVFQQHLTATDLVKTMGENGLLDPSNRENNNKLMQSLAGKSLGAKQQFLGSAMTAYQTYQNQMAQNQAAQQQLKWFSQNPNAFNLKMNMAQPNPGQRSAYGYGSTPPQTSQDQPQQQTPNVSPQASTPDTKAPAGPYMKVEKGPSGEDLHVVRGPDGNIISIYKPDGTPFGK